MLSNTLLAIETTIRKDCSSDLDVESFVDFFKNYRRNMWIYPGTLKRKFPLSFSQIYNFLSSLEKQDILESYYELYCPNCSHSMGLVRFFNELPETFSCDECEDELITLENILLVYKVIRDD